MNNNTMTVKLWNEITEVQSENLNGGSGYGYGYGYSYNPTSINFNGGVGAVQINGGDGAQVNISPTGKGPVNRYSYGYGRYH
jgi:CubicO group peptidase (beta-lactamase class C family)